VAPKSAAYYTGDLMDPSDVRQVIRRLDTRKSLEAEEVWAELRPLGEALVSSMLEAYPAMRTWQGRAALLYHATRYARSSDDAFRLGLLALGDRSFLVRYRACGLLAYSLRADAMPELEALLAHRDPRTQADARAALDAIRCCNHHYFVDRDHSGQSFWHVNDGDTRLPFAPSS